MAVFSHNGRRIAYQSEFAPFAHDLLLLHSSQFNASFWRPVLEALRCEPPASGRVITCDWQDEKRGVEGMAEDLNALMRTLGLQSVHVVACGDAAAVAGDISRQSPSRFTNVLFYPRAVPDKEDLIAAIREFAQI